MNRLPKTATLAMLLTLAVGCGEDAGDPNVGSHIGNPSSVGFHLTSSTDNPDVAGLQFVDSGGTVFSLTSARATLEEIRLELPEGVTCNDLDGQLIGATCEAEDSDMGDEHFEVQIEGPFELDLVAGTASPSLAAVNFPAATYERVRYRFGGEEQNGEAFTAEAAFAHGDVSSLSLSIELDDDMEFAPPGGIAITKGGLITFDVGQWLQSVDVGGCLDDGELVATGGAVMIDRSTDGCDDVHDTINDNITASATLTAAE